MSVKDYLKTRKSTRDYRNRDLSMDLIKKIETGFIDLSNGNDFKIDFQLALDGERVYNALDGYAGYSGFMIKSPHYVFCVEESGGDRQALLNAYAIEDAIELLSGLDVGSCYVTVKDAPKEARQKAFGSNFDKIKYILAMGQPSKGFSNLEATSNPRKSIEDFVYKDKPYNSFGDDELVRRGLAQIFYYARLAPSTQNLQPWRYIVKNDEILLITKLDEIREFTYTDLGIQMHYFKKLAEHGGFAGSWEVVTGEEIDGHEVVARFKL